MVKTHMEMPINLKTMRMGGHRRQPMRVHNNEPFTPIVNEETDGNEAHILRLQLPDFNEHRVVVKVGKERGTVVVTGDRNVGDDRLHILDETYSIPQNSQIDQIEHKFKDGVLSITIPKQITEPVTTSPETKAEIKEPKAGGSGKAEITMVDQKIRRTEKKEIIEKRKKESKTEEVGKNEEISTKIGTGAPWKLAGGYTVRRMKLRATVSLSVVVVIAVASYFAYCLLRIFVRDEMKLKLLIR